MKLFPDGFKLIHVKKEDFGGIAYVYIMGLPGDLDKFLKKVGSTSLTLTKGVPGYVEPSTTSNNS